jgi:uroporphyrinogen decarboxylase
MTPRQRVLASIDHKEPDKIPIDLGGTICTTVSATANKKLKKFMKIDKDGELITHPLLDVVLPLPEILDQFETDCRTVRLKAPTSDDDDGQPKGGYVQMSLSDKPQGHGMPDEYGTTWKKVRV